MIQRTNQLSLVNNLILWFTHRLNSNTIQSKVERRSVKYYMYYKLRTFRLGIQFRLFTNHFFLSSHPVFGRILFFEFVNSKNCGKNDIRKEHTTSQLHVTRSSNFNGRNTNCSALTAINSSNSNDRSCFTDHTHAPTLATLPNIKGTKTITHNGRFDVKRSHANSSNINNMRCSENEISIAL